MLKNQFIHQLEHGMAEASQQELKLSATGFHMTLDSAAGSTAVRT